MNFLKIKNHQTQIILLGALIGICSFLIIYGFTPLNVQNDSWIFPGYNELDIVQHYGGWLHFRESPWSFPLGFTENLSVPTGTIISYTDSIPVVAIFFKIFSDILPETFQYFGIYTLLCFILQGVSAALLISLFCDNKIYILISTTFFTFSPILLERAFRHTALGSHFLILFALYLYFKQRRGDINFSWHISYMILTVLAIGIHPYFLPMIYGIYFIALIENILKNESKLKTSLKNIMFLGSNITLTVLFGFILGVLSFGINSYSRGGYGYFSMNLNAILNPYSVGNYTWSRFLRVQNQLPGQYDGFNFLGLGILFSLLAILIFICITFNKIKFYKFIKQNLILILLCTAFTLFAVSNVVAINSFTFTIPLPNWILNLCGIFRASSRIFYPVYYLIILSIIIFIYNNLNISKAIITITFILSIQLIDLSGVIIGKHLYFSNPPVSTIIDNEYLQDLKGDYTFLCALHMPNDYLIASLAGKMELKTNVTSSLSDGYPSYVYGAEQYDNLLNGKYDKNTIYITSDATKIDEINQNLDKISGLELFVYDRYLFLIPSK